MAQIALMAAATAVSALGTIAGGAAQKSASDFEAKQLDIRGQEEKAASQREAMDARKNKELALSRGQAVAASSGLGTEDPTVVDLMSGVEQKGEYQASMALYGGDERARGARAQAAASRQEGKNAQTASFWKAGSTILGGAANMYGSYAGGGPPASTSETPAGSLSLFNDFDASPFDPNAVTNAAYR